MCNGILDEAAAMPMTLAQFKAFTGSDEVLRVVADSGFDIGEILYRYADPSIDDAEQLPGRGRRGHAESGL